MRMSAVHTTVRSGRRTDKDALWKQLCKGYGEDLSVEVHYID